MKVVVGLLGGYEEGARGFDYIILVCRGTSMWRREINDKVSCWLLLWRRRRRSRIKGRSSAGIRVTIATTTIPTAKRNSRALAIGKKIYSK